MRKLVGVVVLALIGLVGTTPASAAVPLTNFAPHIDYPVVGGPYDIARADFNRDGHNDLASAGGSSVSVLLGTGSKSFGSAISYDVPGGADFLVVADFNSDGVDDLATAYFFTLSVLLGTGTGSFGSPSEMSVGGRTTLLVTADFNSDGDADVAVVTDAATRSSRLAVFHGLGNGSFTAGTTLDVPETSDLQAADVNHDGRVDLIAVLGQSPELLLFLGRGSGAFAAPTSIANVGGFGDAALVIGDVNEDGDEDLLVGEGNSVLVLLGTGTGSFSNPTAYPPRPGPGPHGVQALAPLADFNGDGFLDVAAFIFEGTCIATILLGEADGEFLVPATGRSEVPCHHRSSTLTTGDFNEDGRPDVAGLFASTSGVSVLFNDPKPHMSSHDVELSEGGSGTIAVPAVLHLDGPTDHAVTTRFATRDGTAIAGSDYVASSGTATIPPGATAVTLPIRILGDKVIEPFFEEFFVDLTDVAGAYADVSTITVSINNDDKPPRVTPQNSARTEGDFGTTTATVRITLDRPSPNLTVSVRFNTRDGSALAGSDYVAKSGTMTFAPGETSKAVTISLLGDSVLEPDEQFVVHVHHVQNAFRVRPTATVTIRDDDS